MCRFISNRFALHLILLLGVVALTLVGCGSTSPAQEPVTNPSDELDATSHAYDIGVNSTNPQIAPGETVILTLLAEDDESIDAVKWQAFSQKTGTQVGVFADPLGASISYAVPDTMQTDEITIVANSVVNGQPYTSSTTLAVQSLQAIIPDIRIRLRVSPGYDSESVYSGQAPVIVRAPQVLDVVDVDDASLWVKVAVEDGLQGWIDGTILTFSGDKNILPRDLRFFVITGRDDLSFVYGRTIQDAESDDYYLRIKPNAALEGNVVKVDGREVQVPPETNVTVLEEDFDANWYYLQVIDPQGASLVWKGWLPRSVVEPRNP